MQLPNEGDPMGSWRWRGGSDAMGFFVQAINILLTSPIHVTQELVSASNVFFQIAKPISIHLRSWNSIIVSGCLNLSAFSGHGRTVVYCIVSHTYLTEVLLMALKCACKQWSKYLLVRVGRALRTRRKAMYHVYCYHQVSDNWDGLGFLTSSKVFSFLAANYLSAFYSHAVVWFCPG